MACQKVLDTTELHELILHKLPMRDLLLAQRVSKTWRELIQRSNKLQRALFLKPVKCGLIVHKRQSKSRAKALDCSWLTTGPARQLTGKEASAYANMPGIDLGGNVPIIIKDDDSFELTSDLFECQASGESMEVFKNPLLRPHFESPYCEYSCAELCDSFYETLPRSWLAPNASWRSMYLTQPPCLVTFSLDNDHPSSGLENSAAVTQAQQAAEVIQEYTSSLAARGCDWWSASLNAAEEMRELVTSDEIETLPRRQPESQMTGSLNRA